MRSEYEGKQVSEPSKDDRSLRLSRDADPAVCNFWPALQCCCSASRNFAPIFEALLAWPWSCIFPTLVWALGTAEPPLVTCGSQQGLRNFASTSTTVTICSPAKTYTSNREHNCINFFFLFGENQEMWNSCVCCLWEKSGEFLVSNSRCSAPIGRNPQSPNSHTAVSAAESNHLGEKRIFLEESWHFPADFKSSCWFHFVDLRGDENAHHQSFVKIGLIKVKGLGKHLY